MKFPLAPDLTSYFPVLARMVAETSLLPHPQTVTKITVPVFPTVRQVTHHPRFSEVTDDTGMVIGMYDDNATPHWSIYWAHDIQGTRPKGRHVAHVWPFSKDMNSYTNLANLAMVPEAFANLTDKKGPLTEYLRWHAWTVYGWKPLEAAKPTKPDGFDEIQWRHLDYVDDPKALIRQRFNKLDNQRTKILRPIMERRNML